MAHDMFDETLSIAGNEITGLIQWKKEQVDLISAYVVQLDGAGTIIGAAYGVATKRPDRPNDFPIKNDELIVDGEPQPTWRLAMHMVPGLVLRAGQPAMGLAFYRQTGAQVAAWITSRIAIEA
jgi:hypothetical protein